jgi:hypothetical protein
MRGAAQQAGRRRRTAPEAVREVTGGIVCFCGKRFGEDEALELMLHLRAEYGEELARAERIREYWRGADRKRNADPAKRAARREKYKARIRERRDDPELGGLITDLERERRHRWLAKPEVKAAQAARKKREHAERKQQKDATCPICGTAFAQYSGTKPETCSYRCGQELRRRRRVAGEVVV